MNIFLFKIKICKFILVNILTIKTKAINKHYKTQKDDS